MTKVSRILRFGAAALLPDGATVLSTRGRIVLVHGTDGSRLTVLAWAADGSAVRAPMHRDGDRAWSCRVGAPGEPFRPLWLAVCRDGRQQVLEVLSEELCDEPECPLAVFEGVPRQGPYGAGGFIVANILAMMDRAPSPAEHAERSDQPSATPFVPVPVRPDIDLIGLLMLDEEHAAEIVRRSLGMAIARKKDRIGVMACWRREERRRGLSIDVYTFAENADVADAEEMTISVHAVGSGQALKDLTDLARRCVRMGHHGQMAMDGEDDEEFAQTIVDRVRRLAAGGVRVIKARNRNRF